MPSPFAITAPATTVYLAENRLGKMPFTVSNMTDHQLQGHASVVPLDAVPPEWFKIIRGVDINLAPKSSSQVLVQVEPPLGVVASEHDFRLDVADLSTPDVTIPGPSCSFVVPPSQPKFSWKTPRGYLATLAGASIGGLWGELAILFFAQAPKDKDCGSNVNCAVGNVFAYAIFLILAILAGIVLLWIGAAVGAGIGLRVRSYLGSKTTAVFLAILMIPWTIAMLWLLSKLTDNLVVLMILAPVLLTAVPGVLARGAVLLIRTKRI